MLRLGAIFVVICMVLIAGSVGAVLFMIGMRASDAALAGLGVFSALAICNAVATRLRDRADLGAQIADLSRGSADLARQVGELGRRVATLEARSEASADRLQSATAPLAAELGEIGTLVRQLAETVANHETALARATAPARSAEGAGARPFEPVPAEAKASPAPAHRHDVAREQVIAEVRGALDAGRVDLYLQPIVTLPQRKVRFYEALTRLRTEDGRTLQPDEFLEVAEGSGHVARLDQTQLFRCVQVLRRLQQKNRDIGLFCNVSAVTLNDPQFFPQMARFMDANRALAPSLLLEFKQSAWRGMGPLELESLAALREVGFRFCMDQVTDLRMEPRDLAERGIRYVKAPASLLLGRSGGPGTDIHVADLSNLLGRFGIALVADRIEEESEVVDLLDYDLKFGQGNLFSPPRPVRAEALQGSVDADDAKPDTGSGAAPERPASPAAAAL